MGIKDFDRLSCPPHAHPRASNALPDVPITLEDTCGPATKGEFKMPTLLYRPPTQYDEARPEGASVIVLSIWKRKTGLPSDGLKVSLDEALLQRNNVRQRIATGDVLADLNEAFMALFGDPEETPHV